MNARGAKRGLIGTCCGLLFGLPLAHTQQAVAAVGCRLQLRVHLSPEVPDSRDPGFLSSLANEPGYVLTWLGESPEDMMVRLTLTGSAPDYLCREEVERLRRDARVLDVEVLTGSAALDE